MSSNPAIHGALHCVFAVALLPAASAQTALYFTEYQFNAPKIKSIDLNGSNLHELFTIPSNQWLPLDPEVDVTGGQIYWCDYVAPYNILRANLDGTGLTSVMNVSSHVRGPDLDGAGKLYFTSGSSILRANTDGTGSQILFTAIQTSPISEPYVDATNAHVYFGADGELKRIDLDGSNPKSIAKGVSTPRSLELDIAARRLYWIDSNTISDFIGRVNLDGTDFRVLIDNSPSVVQSSGLLSLAIDLNAGKVYYADDIAGTITRADLTGGGVTPFYSSPAGLSPSGVVLDTGRTAQPIADCNGNGVADGLDIAQSASSDCNSNGVPDECEAAPCITRVNRLDQGSDPVPPSRTIGGPNANPGSRFEVFQPFDVPAGGWALAEIGLDGWTANYGIGSGFTATLFPDNGSGTFANESSPIVATPFQFRFDTERVVWLYEDFAASLSAGRYWVRLSANDVSYHGAINVGTSGLASISRSGLGNLTSSSPVALRLIDGCPSVTSYCTAKLNSCGFVPIISAQGLPSATAGFGFSVRATQTKATKSGLLLYSATGPGATPFDGGLLCLQAPVKRSVPVTDTTGTSPNCNGVLTIDMNAFAVGALGGNPLPALTIAGTRIDCQFWGRDTLANGSLLSGGLEYSVCP